MVSAHINVVAVAALLHRPVGPHGIIREDHLVAVVVEVVLALAARPARAHEAPHPHAVADLELGHPGPLLGDDADDLVAGDTRVLGVAPLVAHLVQVAAVEWGGGHVARLATNLCAYQRAWLSELVMLLCGCVGAPPVAHAAVGDGDADGVLGKRAGAIEGVGRHRARGVPGGVAHRVARLGRLRGRHAQHLA